MTVGSKRNMVLIGFLLSLISITFNSVVIAYVNGRLKAVDDERAKLSDALERQASTLSEGDAQFAIYRVMHNLRFAVQPAMAGEVQQDAAETLGKALEKWHQSAYDIPQIEMTRADVDEFGQQLPLMEKGLQLAQARENATSAEERARLDKELDALQKQTPEPTSDLGRKIRELQMKAGDAENSKSDAAFYSSLLPLIKSFQTQTLESSNKKRIRIRELEDERASLVTRANYASYGAIAFQLLGLMFILTRDLLSQKKAAQA
jgi:hypothetical protein